MVMALDKMPALSDYGAIIAQFLPFVVLIVVFYFFLIRPQRKRDKQERDMRNSIEIGDEISTIGGLSAALSASRTTFWSSSLRATARSSRFTAGRSAVRRLRRPRRSRRPRKQRRTQSNNPISCRIA